MPIVIQHSFISEKVVWRKLNFKFTRALIINVFIAILRSDRRA